jgi:hypothetical protein
VEQSDDPPTLDYHKPEAPLRPKPTPAARGIGCLGFIVYGALALLFLAWSGLFAFNALRVGAPPAVIAVGAVALCIGLFCAWRAAVAFWQCIG